MTTTLTRAPAARPAAPSPLEGPVRPTVPASRLPAGPARRAALALMAKVRGGALIVAEDGLRHTFGSGEPVAHLRVHNQRGYAAALSRGSVGLGQAYAAGWWDSDDLVDLLRVAHRTVSTMHPVRNALAAVLAPIRDRGATADWIPDLRRDRGRITAHYDIGNEFFASLLDPTMTYSGAVFAEPGTSLHDAQREKMRRLVTISGLRPEESVLEIGTGWGAFAMALAHAGAASVTTTTISERQHTLASKRIARAGLADRVQALDLDYRELQGRFDRVFAVEMIEAVDWRDYDTFFGTCARLLKGSGSLTMQAIVVPDEAFHRVKHSRDFIKEQIFPGGCLPSVDALTRAGQRQGLAVQQVHHHGPSYARTLEQWRERLLAIPDLDPEFRRLWEFYLAYCEAGFREGYLGLVQIRFDPVRR